MKLAVLGSLAAVAATVMADDHYNEDHQEDIVPEWVGFFILSKISISIHHEILFVTKIHIIETYRDEDPFTSRSLANSPVPLPVLAMLTMMNFFNALQVG